MDVEFDNSVTQFNSTKFELISFLSTESMAYYMNSQEEFDLLVIDQFSKISTPSKIILTNSDSGSMSFLNILVFMFYYKVKRSNRVYVLTLIFLDLFAVYFVLIPAVVLNVFRYKYSSELKTPIIFIYFCGNFVFGTYIYPSILLGFDRFVAVFTLTNVKRS